jgi:hypothetical protein
VRFILINALQFMLCFAENILILRSSDNFKRNDIFKSFDVKGMWALILET